MGPARQLGSGHARVLRIRDIVEDIIRVSTFTAGILWIQETVTLIATLTVRLTHLRTSLISLTDLPQSQLTQARTQVGTQENKKKVNESITGVVNSLRAIVLT